jgi:hypothetical protein
MCGGRAGARPYRRPGVRGIVDANVRRPAQTRSPVFPRLWHDGAVMRKQTKRKPRTHFEQVPISVVKAIVDREASKTNVHATRPNAGPKRPLGDG